MEVVCSWGITFTIYSHFKVNSLITSVPPAPPPNYGRILGLEVALVLVEWGEGGIRDRDQMAVGGETL